MKTYIFELALYHESFSGYDHYDGNKSIEVKARHLKSAEKKLAKLAKEYNNGRQWYQIVSIVES